MTAVLIGEVVHGLDPFEDRFGGEPLPKEIDGLRTVADIDVGLGRDNADIGCAPGDDRADGALLHGSEQIADLPVPVAESPGAVRIGHPERGHLVEYLAPNSVFNSLPRQRSSPHLRPDDRFVTIDRVFHHASLGAA